MRPSIDHELRYVGAHGFRLGDEETQTLMANAFAAAHALTRNVERVLDPRAQELAFGAPGQPGDEERIEHLAGRLVSIYEAFLDWAAQLRAASVPERFERAVELLSSFADNPISEFREFIDRFVTETDAVPSLLREERDEPVRLEITLTLTIDDRTLNAFNREMRRLR